MDSAFSLTTEVMTCTHCGGVGGPWGGHGGVVVGGGGGTVGHSCCGQAAGSYSRVGGGGATEGLMGVGVRAPLCTLTTATTQTDGGTHTPLRQPPAVTGEEEEEEEETGRDCSEEGANRKPGPWWVLGREVLVGGSLHCPTYTQPCSTSPTGCYSQLTNATSSGL